MPESHTKRIAKKGSFEAFKKILKMIPIIGPVFSVGFAGHDIKKKGLIPGAVHVALDVTPVVGTAKNVVEIFRGDWIPYKPKPNLEPNQVPPQKSADESAHSKN